MLNDFFSRPAADDFYGIMGKSATMGGDDQVVMGLGI
jgi:hypothetical protein